MTNRDLAEKIYEDLNKRGADLGNASIGIIRKTLDDNGVKNCSISDVVGQSEQLKSLFEKHRNETGKLSMDEPTAQKLLKRL